MPDEVIADPVPCSGEPYPPLEGEGKKRGR
jgi:hypothetical protein